MTRGPPTREEFHIECEEKGKRRRAGERKRPRQRGSFAPVDDKQQLRQVELGDGEILSSFSEDALRMISTALREHEKRRR